ncbi:MULTISPECIES: tRNA (adenosine(37)-N6)-dimethylallyltransferase MiaA [Campylobacter]|uniref:tRNA (adenosine(37)-N6)-dimethylallyltransferase MiaA n=1 Tax=Campylobacter molothri TaxID=1032242 RepID=UPI001906BF98|nr:tRNA (adenosine(37)-N6)-dimethylallyltransferase MiaA [Campylobacter sp. 2018MI35]MBZ7943749.1 tRNA (adenosine(37)-N6)-dimethylallyltransferase MiaA [Campylobacter sp. RM13744]MBZ7948259.1 tRNA (adenosine(37)-N6)-dimethylallyltransferase MiaA [Campylobacter sp. RM9929]MBZ7960084.1 tRNA (adenosine(37)-N6)-dimethylallyltransferase MiaA [Campylobacter sp. RM12397]MBZ7961192.1 tRNA (adenosine(37)-N6)-dimethylallyltransferase MiaA [Campylobacter sp. RM9930]MBZ7965950.1 tRNA (adenosine(37)-N6)-di
MFFEIAIIGTTASGKTHLANLLAKNFDAVILSLDSLCVYKEINIASAKPSKEELENFHYFGINLISVNEHFNVDLFIKEYQKAKEFAKLKNLPLIITGGTGFYLKTMIDGLSQKIEEIKTDLSNDEIYSLICKIDPDFKIEKNDTYRLRKWLSIYEITKEIPSIFLKQTRKQGILKNIEIYEIIWERNLLRDRIKIRTEKMLKNGLLEEAKELFSKFHHDTKALNCIGLKECKEYLNGKISLNELENLITTHTAQLAKRQRTFNKKFQSVSLNFNEAFEFLKQKFMH